MKNLVASTALVALLSACASTNTGIVQIGDDIYMYGKQDWMAYSGSAVKADLYKEAAAFCAGKGKKFVPINSTAGDYQPMRASAAAEIQFACK